MLDFAIMLTLRFKDFISFKRFITEYAIAALSNFTIKLEVTLT